MADIQAVIEGVATALETIPGLQVHTEPPGTVAAPAAVVALAGIDYDTTMARGTDDLTITVDLFVSLSGTQGMQHLYAYLDGAGEKSIVQAVAGDVTLGGVAEFVYVDGASKPDRVEMGQTELYHVEVSIVAGVPGAVL